MSFCLYLTLRFLRSLAAINHSWKFAKFVIRFPTLGKAGETPAVRFPTLGTFSSNPWKAVVVFELFCRRPRLFGAAIRVFSRSKTEVD